MALAKKATDVVMDVKKVALPATMMVCVSLLWTVSKSFSFALCLNVFRNTKTSSTPIPMITNSDTTFRIPKVVMPRTTLYTKNARGKQVMMASSPKKVENGENPLRTNIRTRMSTPL